MTGTHAELGGGRTGVVLLGFGEPVIADELEVEAFLERIFLAGASLEAHEGERATARARALARARAPELTETYRRIGGSPLMDQIRGQAEGLATTLAARGRPYSVTVATQFTSPTVEDMVDWARLERLDRVVALPTYPVCGPSTTLAALERLAVALEELADVEVFEVTGWHRHPGFAAMWASAIREHAVGEGIDIHDSGTLLYFSIHGTPVKYLDRVPYTQYVEEACAAVADELSVAEYAQGYQNHDNRPVPWVQPDNRTLVRQAVCERLVVVPLGFVHEQSETLDDLDRELRDLATERGLGFHRVPVPHDHAALFELWADLVEGVLEANGTPALGPCDCRVGGMAWCARRGPRS